MVDSDRTLSVDRPLFQALTAWQAFEREGEGGFGRERKAWGVGGEIMLNMLFNIQ